MPAEPAPGQAAYEAAALAIMNANNANDDEPERFEAALMAKVALEAGVPELSAEIASLREQLAQARAERDSYRRLAVKIGDALCSNASHAAKIRTIWELTELAPQAAADAAREALEGGGDG